MTLPRQDLILLPGGTVVLTGAAVLDAVTAFELLAQVHRSNGGGLAPRLARLRDFFAVASADVRGSVPGTTEPLPADGVPVFAMTDPITPLEVGQLLGVSDTYVRRLCRVGSFETAAQPDGRHWLVERGEILAQVEKRKAS